jgi:transcription antitermination factor NusG
MSERSPWHVLMTKGKAVVRVGEGGGARIGNAEEARRLVKVRGEMAVERELRALGFETYCPRFLDTAPLRCPGSKHRPRRVAVERPLFAGYVFVALPRPEDQVTVRYVRGVIDLVRADEVTPIRVPEVVIGDLMAREGKYGLIPLSQEQRLAWRAGDWARVLAGPFSGFEAQVDEDVAELGVEAEDGRGGAVDREVRIRTLVSLFGRLTPLSIEPWHLERL